MRRFISMMCILFLLLSVPAYDHPVTAGTSHTVQDSSLVAPQVVAPQPAVSQAADLDWATTFSPRGLSFDVNAVAVSGNSVYVGGGFVAAGNVEADYIARYDLITQTWSPLGVGAPDTVNAILIDGNDIYVGGENYLSRWNTISNTWTALGYANGFINDLAKSGNYLYVGGGFDWIEGVTATYAARLDLSTGVWSPLGSGTNGGVLALTISGNMLYAGGAFTQAGGNTAVSVAQWNINTNTWAALGSGPASGTTYALTMNGAELIAGGDYSNVDGTRVFRWDGSSWHAMGTGTYSTIDALNVNIHGIYAGGDTSAILRWDGSNWVQVGAELAGHRPDYPTIQSLAYANDHLYVGGTFTAAGSITAMRAADLNLTDDTWSVLFSGSGGNGLDGDVNTIVISGTDVYVGGSFTRAGPIAAKSLAKWDSIGNSWSVLGAGVIGGDVRALALQGNTLYVGGSFMSAGGSPAHYIAQWDTIGQTWSTLTSNGKEGVSDFVSALAISGTKVYVGGFFTRVGLPDGPVTDYFAVWNSDTSIWTTVNPGLKYYVDAIAVHGTDVYVGGGFYPQMGSNFDGLARWDTVGVGNQWSGISGVSANVYALAVSGNDLFVGGTFSPRIKRLNMTDNTWLPMNGSVYDSGGYGGLVYAIAAHADGDIYVGGDFTGAGGLTAYNLARWNPACDFWLPVGKQGVYGRVLALALTSNQLLVGGQFPLASEASGNVPSARLANLAHQSITCRRAYLPSILK
jgi:hypothetical protein